MIENFRQLAQYNQWANARLYEVALKLTEETIARMSEWRLVASMEPSTTCRWLIAYGCDVSPEQETT